LATAVAPPSAPAKAAAPAPAAPASAKKEALAPLPAPAATAREDEDEADVRSSPLVRKLAREHNVDLASVSGTGTGGRVTKQDVLDFLERRAAAPASPQTSAPAPAVIPGDLVPMSKMRKIIAQRMIESRRRVANISGATNNANRP
jgi:pyruvate dehydrogenase E2 component (dihydrolipoamide acetyltransferase)